MTVACITSSFFVAVNMALKAGSEIIPDITPWSYPNSKKPIVATVETVRDNGRPVKPIYVGGAMVTIVRNGKR